MIELRDGSHTDDPRLGALRPLRGTFQPPLRLPREATRSSHRPVTKFWECKARYFQGPLGSCFPHSIAHALAARPIRIVMRENRPTKLYFQIQLTDGIEGGEYDGANPVKGGSRAEDNFRVFRQAGFITGARQANSFDELVLGIGYVGTPVIATDWYEGMNEPDRHGFVRPVGKVIGRHAYCGLGVHVKERYFEHLNSWYRPPGEEVEEIPWGDTGKFRISYPDMLLLLRKNAEIYFLEGQSKP
jgi:hypothetical protein